MSLWALPDSPFRVLHATSWLLRCEASLKMGLPRHENLKMPITRTSDVSRGQPS